MVQSIPKWVLRALAMNHLVMRMFINIIGMIFILFCRAFAEAVAQRCSTKKLFRNFCKIHRKTRALESPFLTLQAVD